MKADDYAIMYRAAGSQNDGLVKVGVEFVRETSEIINKRKIQGNSAAYLAVIKEQADKWKAFARRVNDGIKEDGYLIIIRNEFPMLAPYV